MANVSKSEPFQQPASGAPAASRRGASEQEKELVRRAQAGDGRAYEELVRTHQRRIFAVVTRILRGREDIEDVAQQVFVKAYFSLRRFDLRSTFSTWLYKIAVNECWDYLRKKRVRPLSYEGDLSEEHARRLEAMPAAPSAAANPEQRAALRDLVERLLSELKEKDRLMMELKEMDGFSVEEIGQALGLNVNTVKVRLFRARARLAELYRQKLQPHPRSAAAEGKG